MSISIRRCGCLALPREIGRHPETGETITAGIGRFGPYIKHGATFKSLGADDDVLTIGLNRAVVLLAEPAPGRRRGAPQPLRELGAHPDGGVVALYQGRYGPYVSHDGVFASLPRTADPEIFSLEEAIALLAARRKKTPRRIGKSAKSAAAKPPPRKSTKSKAAPERVVAATKKAGAARSAKKPRPRTGAQPG